MNVCINLSALLLTLVGVEGGGVNTDVTSPLVIQLSHSETSKLPKINPYDQKIVLNVTQISRKYNPRIFKKYPLNISKNSKISSNILKNNSKIFGKVSKNSIMSPKFLFINFSKMSHKNF